jgi:hypothetical protein
MHTHIISRIKSVQTLIYSKINLSEEAHIRKCSPPEGENENV